MGVFAIIICMRFKNQEGYYFDHVKRRWVKRGGGVKRIDFPMTIPPLKTINHDSMESIIRAFAPGDVQESVDLATFAHEGAVRKNLRLGVKDPYIAHPLRNTVRALTWVQGRMDDDVVLDISHACLLHDVVEDAPERVQEFYHCYDDPIDIIADRFGDNVAHAVDAVSNPVNNATTREEKNGMYVEHLGSVLPHDDIAVVVKCSDLWDNAGSLVYADDSMAQNLSVKYLPVISMTIPLVEKMGNEVMVERMVRLQDMALRMSQGGRKELLEERVWIKP